MKKILGLDLGTNSIGWAVVNEAENNEEKSSIIKLGVRVNPLTVDELQNFQKGKSITTNADRTQKRSMRRNLQRYKLRREVLKEFLKQCDWITDESILSENGNKTTFETYHLRAKAAVEEISLEQFARVLLMINKKRGYKSSRKAKDSEEGSLIDGMEIAKLLYNKGLTPGGFCLQLLETGKKYLPDFYRSDLQSEFDRIWDIQKLFYPNLLTDEVKDEVRGKNKTQTWAILAKYFVWTESEKEWNQDEARNIVVEKEHRLEGSKRQTKRDEQKIENYQWRVKALTEKLHPEEIAIVLQEINSQISNSSGYLGAISDRSKELFFNKQTVGQFQMTVLAKNPNTSLKNMVFYRQDYLDEFNTLWEKQAEYHKELTGELKKEIRDIIIFYQRHLKSQKGLISFCEFEQKDVEFMIDGKLKKKTIGHRVIPRSSPLFQEFKIWQILNNIEVSVVGKKGKRKKKNSMPTLFDDVEDVDLLDVKGRRFLYPEEKEQLAKELSVRKELTKADALKLLFEEPQSLDLNYKVIDGNSTGYMIYRAYSTMLERTGHEPIDFKKSADEIKKQVQDVFTALGWKTDILTEFDCSKELDEQPYYMLWHLLYSFEGDNTPTGNGNLIKKISDLFGINEEHVTGFKEYAVVLANVAFQDDYGSLCTKAIRKILPHLKDGNQYDVACEYAGYRHSKSSLTQEEIENKALKDKLELLPKNSLRNPVVEKILNQMVNVVNAVIDTYGKPDEIRIELARELKKNAKEREELIKAISKSTDEHTRIKETLEKEFGLSNVSRNDIVRYKLYEELKPNGYKTLYSNQYISREKLFSKEFDIEHIIPKAKLFDDSFSNKTIEQKDINIAKGNMTAYDFVKTKYGDEEATNYVSRMENLFGSDTSKKTKLKKLKMQGADIPTGFIERDIRDTQYIAKKAKNMLEDLVKFVVSTTGSVTDRLREDWQLVDVMKELNWDKYNQLGLTEIVEDKDGRKIRKIKDWTKRNDHRHHAMDALTIAFTKRSYIQYLNNLNARRFKEEQGISNAEKEDWNRSSITTDDVLSTNDVLGIERKELYRDGRNKLRFIPPIALDDFRAEAKIHLENTLISIKAKNKVATTNINITKAKEGTNKKQQSTPRGQLHNETIYGSSRRYATKEERVGASFNEAQIAKVCKATYREALLNRLHKNGGDPKKAFTGKNSLSKNPIYLDQLHISQVPEKVKIVSEETIYTIRKEVTPDLNIEKVIDVGVRRILEQRLQEYGNDVKKAFANLDENPIWLNEARGIAIKRVTILGISNAQSLHEKRDKEGNLIFDETGNLVPVDFVNTGNNHHVAIYRRPVLDKMQQLVLNDNGEPIYELEEMVVSFFDAVTRMNLGLPIIDKEYKYSEGWEFLFSMKQNEYFVFPNEKTGFNPHEIDLMNPDNYSLISPNMFRVQKIATKDYSFRHHLETTVENNNVLKEITWNRCGLKGIENIIKVRLNHIGQIVSVGEY